MYKMSQINAQNVTKQSLTFNKSKYDVKSQLDATFLPLQLPWLIPPVVLSLQTLPGGNKT